MAGDYNNQTVRSQKVDFISEFLKSSDTDRSTDSESTKSGQVEPVSDAVFAEQVIDALRGVYDPEIPVNIYDLGLIYDVDISDDRKVSIQMTLTTPGCPVAQTFPGTVECAVRCVEGVEDATVELVWDPPWTKDRMSEDALLSLGLL